ncbi:superinfection immunity protein [Leptothrix discophora]|uniref:Superinfection immunity protein n=1 Tax=Leptothrix discophora TaxID=89 RepID=A0ABT9G1K4_LEPDI|nr:superinfection immunity protein [Leptothrix discophora]MDP4300370.1 superinfection immunity protein [Leptothrix discophora]
MDGVLISVLVLAAIVAAVAAYLLPALIASWRDHPQERRIMWINLLARWTGFGWLAAVLWAVAYFPPPVPRVRGDHTDEEILQRSLRACPMCLEEIKVEARRCRHCGADVGQVSA